MNDGHVIPARRRRGQIIPFRAQGGPPPGLPGSNLLVGNQGAGTPDWFAAPSPWLASIPRSDDRRRDVHVPGMTDQRVRFDEGPPWPSKSYHAPSWYRHSDAKKLKLLRKYAKEYGRDPRLRQFVIKYVLEPKGVLFPSRQWEGQAKAILSWLQANIAYVNEPGELLQGPWHTLKVRSADCDDMATLGASMAESIMLPWRFVLAGKKTDGTPARWAEGTRKPFGVNFQHIYLDFGEPAGKPKLWRAAEPTMPVPLGFDVVLHGARNDGGRLDGGAPSRGVAGWGATILEKPATADWSWENLPARILGVPSVDIPAVKSWGKRIGLAVLFALTIRLAVDKVWKNKRFKKTFKV